MISTMVAHEMLDEMIKSTHELDVILDHMCAAVNEETDCGPAAKDDDFQECITHDHDDDSFQTLRKSLRIDQTMTTVCSLDPHKLQTLWSDRGDATIRFASCTRDTSFVFTSSTASDDSKMTALCPESNISFNYFISRLRQQISTCDHLVPVARADEAGQLASLLLEEQQRRLRRAISSQVPCQREALSWVQSNRLCEVFVQEAQQENQWGLLLQLHVTSQFQARVDEPTDEAMAQHAKDFSHMEVASCTRSKVFLPKLQYCTVPDKESPFLTSIAIDLTVHDAMKQETKTEQPNVEQSQDSMDGKGRGHLALELSELITVSLWGQHDDISAMDPRDTVESTSKSNTFKKVQIKTPFSRNRIVQAACSRFHTLFLNDMGLVFAYGHALDGALGLGNEWSGGYVTQPTLVEFFLDKVIVVQDIACGGDELVGAHSAAVSQQGGLFTWGVDIALGTGTLRSASTPQLIDLPPVQTNVDGDVVTKPLPTAARSVSCGSGFCVALTSSGHAFSWGKWSDGRLGLGRIPIIARTSRRRGGAVRKQFQSFQLRPKQIQTIFTAGVRTACGGVREEALFSKVACGDAHCVALTRTGELVTWGRGNNGQQGRGDASNEFAPTTVFKGRGPKSWRDVAAGENWSMALSRDGLVWTWGACGGAVLGHGHHSSQKKALLAESILQRHQRLLSQCKKSSISLHPRLPRLRWMTPQMVPCFATPDIRISRISAGAQHAAAVSDTGDLYMWGEGYSGKDDTDTDTNGLLLTSLPKLVNSGQGDGKVDQDAADIGMHSVEHVACGGRQTIAFSSGSFLARSMSKLYHAYIAHWKHCDSFQETTLEGGDLVLIVSGQRLMAHKLLLAQRSPVFQELILEEEQQQRNRLAMRDGGGFGHRTEIMELLLPRLRIDIGRALLEFIYTDDFTMEVSNTSYYLVNDVLQAAKVYKLPKLVQLCRERTFSASTLALPDDAVIPSGSNETIDESSESDSDEHNEGQRTTSDSNESSRTLNDDMKSALNNDVLADTVLIAEGRRIPVHRCMLIARSEYFRAVLAFHHSAAHFAEDPHRERNMSVVNVEESYAGIMRVLCFIYYDQVALPQSKTTAFSPKASRSASAMQSSTDEDASDRLLEDLVAADKYGLERMKRLCEHAIGVTVENCLEVLAVAELVNAAHLKQVTMGFVQVHLAAVTARQEEFQRFQTDFPQLLEELYACLRDASQDESLLREWHAEVSSSLAAQHEEQKIEGSKTSHASTFPWIPLSLAVAFGTMYLSMMNGQEHEYAAVPATNLVAIVAIGGAVLLGYL